MKKFMTVLVMILSTFASTDMLATEGIQEMEKIVDVYRWSESLDSYYWDTTIVDAGAIMWHTSKDNSSYWSEAHEALYLASDETFDIKWGEVVAVKR